MKRLAHGSTVIRSSRWTAYASAAVASVFAGAGEAEAEIHYSGPVRHFLDAGTHSTTLAFFDLEGGERLLFDFGRFGAGRGSAFAEIEGVFGDSLRESFRDSQYGDPLELHLGDVISAGSFQPGSGHFNLLADSHQHGLWKGRTTGFLGFRFDLGNGLQYGWVRIRKRPDNSFEVVDYAWGDPGDVVTAGETRSALADKGSLGWLSLGAAGVAAWRHARYSGHGDDPGLSQ